MNKINKKIWIYPVTLMAFATALASCTTPTSSTTPSSSSIGGSSSTTSAATSTVVPPVSSSVSVPTPVSSSTAASTPAPSTPVHIPEVVVSKTQNSIAIKDRDVADYDYTSYFAITVDGVDVAVTSSMIDATEVEAKEGQYVVTCSYEGKSAILVVNVSDTVYAVEATVDTVTIKQKEISTYDFKALFTATMDGEPVTIEDSMITSTIENAVGTYSYTISYNGASKSIEVVVEEDHIIRVLPAYVTKEVAISEVAAFDVTSLFSLYVDGVAKQVTEEMIDSSALEGAEAGKEYAVKITYKEDNSSATAEVKVKVVSDKEVAISAKDVTIQPNAGQIDLKSLFEIKVGGEVVEVTDTMIGGYVDYSKLGENKITVSYDYSGKNYTEVCTVTIAAGGEVGYAKSSVVTVRTGTDANSYAFSDDFVVTINGVRFSNILSYLDTSKVDFNTVGTYEVTVKIPYNDGTEKFIEGKITYNVVDKAIAVNVLNSNIVLDSSVKTYGEKEIFANITVFINNIKQTLSSTDYPGDPVACYAVITSDAVDCTKAGVYTVSVSLYVNGSANDPMVVTFTVEVPSKVVITMSGSNTVLEGTTLDPKSLFTIVDGEETVTVTDSMILGKVDTFNPGIYSIAVDYNGTIKTFDVVVLDNSLIGSYSTNLDEYSDTNSSSGSDEDGEETVTPAKKVGNLVINEDLTITLGNTKLGNFIAIDETTFQASISSFPHIFSLQDGVMIVTPVNTNQMKYSPSNRPFIFFADSSYKVTSAFTVAYSATTSVEQASSSGYYSIYVFGLEDVKTKAVSYYGLKVALIDVDSGNYYYSYAHGQVVLSEGFVPAAEAKGSLTLAGSEYKFTMSSVSAAVADKAAEHEAAYAGTYNGVFNGEDAVLTVDQYDGFRITVGGTQVFSVAGATMRSNIDYENHIATIINDSDGSYGYYSYKIKVNKDDSTFTVLEHTDSYFGMYKVTSTGANAGSYLFLDGFGGGYFKGDSSYSSRVAIEYVIENGMVKVVFKNAKASYTYGTYAQFYIDAFRNTLILGRSDVASMIGLQYDSDKVSQGLKVSISQYTIDAVPEGSEDAAEDLLLSYISITDKNGVVADVDKVSYVDFSNVDFTTAGFYLVTVSTTIDEVKVTKYFTFQVNAPIYEGNALVGSYTSEYSSSYKIAIDMYGNATFTYSSTNYVGTVVIDGVNFTFTGTRVGGTATVTVVGKLELNGVISATVTGDRSHTCYFTSSEVTAYEFGYTRNPIVRAFIVDGETHYFVVTGEQVLGTKVEVTSLNGVSPTTVGAVISFMNGDKEVIAKVSNLNNAYSGLVLPDDNRGTYTSTVVTEDVLVLDGFGTSSSARGVATIGETDYNYYMQSTNLVALYALGDASTIVGYITLDGETYTKLEKTMGADLVGVYSVLSYSGTSASSYQITINEYGVIEHKESSNYYYGVVVLNADGTYSASVVRNTSSISLTLTKLDAHVLNVKKNGTNISSGVFVANSSNLSYVGNSYKNYLTSIDIGEKTVYFLSASSSSAAQYVTIESLNDIAYGTVGSIFTVKDAEGTVVIEKAKYHLARNTSYGYILEGAEAGEYSIEGSEVKLVLDGFANVTANAKGIAVYNGITGSYSIFSDGVITLTYESEGTTVSVKVRIDTIAKTYEIIEATHSGNILGEFKRFTSSGIGSSNVLNFDEFGLGSYGSSNGMVNYSEDGQSFTAILGSTSVSGEIIVPGILYVTVGSNSYFYMQTGDNNVGSVYSGKSSSEHIVYKAVIGEETYYLYQESNSVLYKGALSIEKGVDSKVELGVSGAVFELKDGDKLVFAAKYDKSSVYSGLTPANVAERKIFVSSTGVIVFTDGFGTGATSAKRGTALVDNDAKYTYFYCPSFEKTVIIYAEDGTVYGYVKYLDDGSFEFAAENMTESGFVTGKYTGVGSTSQFFNVDEFGIVTYKDTFFGPIVVTETGFTATVTDYTSVSSVRTVNIVGTTLEDGVVLVTLSGYDSGSNYYTVGKVSYAGLSWKNIIYAITMGEKNSYYLAYANTSSLSNFPGKISVEILNGIEFGTAGSIFKATFNDADGVEQVITGKYVKDNGYSGYELVEADGLEGTYTSEGKASITLNGYGLMIINSETPVSYSYSVNGSVITVVDEDGVATAYTLDTEAKTYVSAVAEANPVENLTFTATYGFSCPSSYGSTDSTTTFLFNSDGTVVVKSSNYDHDSDCPSDYYSSRCDFTNTTGTYTRVGTTVTIQFKSYTVVFTLDSVTAATTMTCTATDIPANKGGFAVGQVFNVK